MTVYTNKSPRLVVTARGIIVQEDKILLVLHDKIWCTPGGWLDAGENLQQCLRREMHEELGVTVMSEKLIFVSEFFQRQEDNKFGDALHKIEHYFLCQVQESNVEKIEWTDLDNGVVKDKRLFSEEDFKSGKFVISPKALANFSISEIFNLKSCYLEKK